MGLMTKGLILAPPPCPPSQTPKLGWAGLVILLTAPHLGEPCLPHTPPGETGLVTPLTAPHLGDPPPPSHLGEVWLVALQELVWGLQVIGDLQPPLLEVIVAELEQAPKHLGGGM